MSEQSGPAIGQEAASPFPAGYGSVRGAGDEAALQPSGPPPRSSGLRRRLTGARAVTASPPTAQQAVGVEPTTWVSPAGETTMAIPVLSQVSVPVRRLVRRVDVWTVFKVSFVFYILFAVILLAAGAVAWTLAVDLHLIRDVERAVRTLADKRRFLLHPTTVLKYAAAAFGALALIGTVVNTVAAILYNLIADLVGGIQTIEVVEED